MPRRPPIAAPRANSAREGIGLCRTEHMFFDAERIANVRQMILADRRGRPPRRARQIAPRPARRFRRDFPDHGRPAGHHPPARSAAARIPAPSARRSIAEVARGSGVDVETLRRRAADLAESNPMLGHRGCRLGITFPEIYEMQARAIFEAALDVAGEGRAAVPRDHGAARRDPRRARHRPGDDRPHRGGRVRRERAEHRLSGRHDDRAAPRRACAPATSRPRRNSSASAPTISPRPLWASAATTPASFLGAYVEQGIFARDPFVSIDVEGVGELISIRGGAGQGGAPRPQARHLRRAWRRSRQHRLLRERRPRLRQASPYRVPIARLAAAQAALRKGLERPAAGRRRPAAAPRPARRRCAANSARCVAAQLGAFSASTSSRRVTSSR